MFNHEGVPYLMGDGDYGDPGPHIKYWGSPFSHDTGYPDTGC